MDALVSDEEMTEVVKDYLRKTSRSFLPFITGPLTSIRELSIVRNMYRYVHYRRGELKFSNERAERLWREMQFGSTRWPALKVEDNLNEHLDSLIGGMLPN